MLLLFLNEHVPALLLKRRDMPHEEICGRRIKK